MHFCRHMKIHEKDASSFPTPSSSRINMRRRFPTKKKPSVEDEVEQAEEPPVKKVHFLSSLCLCLMSMTFGIYYPRTSEFI